MAGFYQLRKNILHIPSIKGVIPTSLRFTGLPQLHVYFHESDRIIIPYDFGSVGFEKLIKDAHMLTEKVNFYNGISMQVIKETPIPEQTIARPEHMFNILSVASYSYGTSFFGYPSAYLRMYQGGTRKIVYPKSGDLGWKYFWQDMERFYKITTKLNERWAQADTQKLLA